MDRKRPHPGSNRGGDIRRPGAAPPRPNPHDNRHHKHSKRDEDNEHPLSNLPPSLRGRVTMPYEPPHESAASHRPSSAERDRLQRDSRGRACEHQHIRDGPPQQPPPRTTQPAKPSGRDRPVDRDRPAGSGMAADGAQHRPPGESLWRGRPDDRQAVGPAHRHSRDGGPGRDRGLPHGQSAGRDRGAAAREVHDTGGRLAGGVRAAGDRGRLQRREGSAAAQGPTVIDRARASKYDMSSGQQRRGPPAAAATSGHGREGDRLGSRPASGHIQAGSETSQQGRARAAQQVRHSSRDRPVRDSSRPGSAPRSSNRPHAKATHQDTKERPANRTLSKSKHAHDDRRAPKSDGRNSSSPCSGKADQRTPAAAGVGAREQREVQQHHDGHHQSQQHRQQPKDPYSLPRRSPEQQELHDEGIVVDSSPERQQQEYLIEQDESADAERAHKLSAGNVQQQRHLANEADMQSDEDDRESLSEGEALQHSEDGVQYSDGHKLSQPRDSEHTDHEAGDNQQQSQQGDQQAGQQLEGEDQAHSTQSQQQQQQYEEGEEEEEEEEEVLLPAADAEMDLHVEEQQSQEQDEQPRQSDSSSHQQPPQQEQQDGSKPHLQQRTGAPAGLTATACTSSPAESTHAAAAAAPQQARHSRIEFSLGKLPAASAADLLPKRSAKYSSPASLQGAAAPQEQQRDRQGRAATEHGNGTAPAAGPGGRQPAATQRLEAGGQHSAVETRQPSSRSSGSKERRKRERSPSREGSRPAGKRHVHAPSSSIERGRRSRSRERSRRSESKEAAARRDRPPSTTRSSASDHDASHHAAYSRQRQLDRAHAGYESITAAAAGAGGDSRDRRLQHSRDRDSEERFQINGDKDRDVSGRDRSRRLQDSRGTDRHLQDYARQGERQHRSEHASGAVVGSEHAGAGGVGDMLSARPASATPASKPRHEGCHRQASQQQQQQQQRFCRSPGQPLPPQPTSPLSRPQRPEVVDNAPPAIAEKLMSLRRRRIGVVALQMRGLPVSQQLTYKEVFAQICRAARLPGEHIDSAAVALRRRAAAASSLQGRLSSTLLPPVNPLAPVILGQQGEEARIQHLQQVIDSMATQEPAPYCVSLPDRGSMLLPAELKGVLW